MEGKDGQTEKATPKRRNKERNKGNLPLSQEVLTVSVLFVAAIALRVTFPRYLRSIRELMEFSVLTGAEKEIWSGIWLQDLFVSGIRNIVIVMTPLMGCVILAGVVASMAQTGPFFSWGALKAGGLKALNPVKGAKKLFSLKSITKLGMILLKIFIITGLIVVFWRRQWMTIAQLHAFGLQASVVWFGHRMFLTLILVCIFAIIVAVIDTVITRYRHERDMMMTKSEVKDERKQMMGNPEVKRAQFRKMRELTMSRLVADVPQSTVVITNPTRVAVALKYDPRTMDAPKVVAKGMRLRAKRIRELARQHHIPIIERPPLARALYKQVPVGRFIPADLFEGVAEVLAYLHRLGHRLQGFSESQKENESLVGARAS